MKLLLTGGGTGGHIYPALSVVKEIKKNEDNYNILYIGTSRGLESKIIPGEKLPFKTIDIRGMPRSFGREFFLFTRDFVKGCLQARKIIKDFKPGVVLGTGGYVCGPVVFMAWLNRLPTVIHEQNVIPGITNKFLAKIATKILVSFEESRQYFPPSKTVVTGNPRASEIHDINKEKALNELSLSKDKKTLLIVSGSQGAEVINDNIIEIINELLENSWLQIIYVTGDKYFKKIREKINAKNSSRIKVYSYLNEMQLALAAADLVVSRAGATTIAEITAFGVPSILIPSPNVTNDHQKINALALDKKEATLMLDEADLTPWLLEEKISEILGDEKYLKKMSKAASSLGHPEAALNVYNILKEITDN